MSPILGHWARHECVCTCECMSEQASQVHASVWWEHYKELCSTLRDMFAQTGAVSQLIEFTSSHETDSLMAW